MLFFFLFAYFWSYGIIIWLFDWIWLFLSLLLFFLLSLFVAAFLFFFFSIVHIFHVVIDQGQLCFLCLETVVVNNYCAILMVIFFSFLQDSSFLVFLCVFFVVDVLCVCVDSNFFWYYLDVFCGLDSCFWLPTNRVDSVEYSMWLARKNKKKKPSPTKGMLPASQQKKNNNKCNSKKKKFKKKKIHRSDNQKNNNKRVAATRTNIYYTGWATTTTI